MILMTQEHISTMGCRTANGWDVNGLGQQKDGRGNICPVTSYYAYSCYAS